MNISYFGSAFENRRKTLENVVKLIDKTKITKITPEQVEKLWFAQKNLNLSVIEKISDKEFTDKLQEVEKFLQDFDEKLIKEKILAPDLVEQVQNIIQEKFTDKLNLFREEVRKIDKRVIICQKKLGIWKDE